MSPLKYREQITAEQITVVDAHVVVPDGPGLGIEVDEDALRHLDAALGASRRQPLAT
jgi:L-alanine-DL-glutamate epimerase-like enolase superfamily enzyme